MYPKPGQEAAASADVDGVNADVPLRTHLTLATDSVLLDYDTPELDKDGDRVHDKLRKYEKFDINFEALERLRWAQMVGRPLPKGAGVQLMLLHSPTPVTADARAGFQQDILAEASRADGSQRSVNSSIERAARRCSARVVMIYETDGRVEVCRSVVLLQCS
jgi:hypothetical protein